MCCIVLIFAGLKLVSLHQFSTTVPDLLLPFNWLSVETDQKVISLLIRLYVLKLPHPDNDAMKPARAKSACVQAHGHVLASWQNKERSSSALGLVEELVY